MLDSLPEVFATELSPSGLNAVGHALVHAEILSVRLKPHTHPLPLDHGRDLLSALAMLQAGEVRGLLVRYRSADAEWLDTLERTASGGRLVRLKLESQAPRAPSALGV